MLCASVFFMSPSYSYAADKVLSPVSSWNLSNGGQARSCSLSAQYESDVILSFSGVNGQISSLTLTDGSASFNSGEAVQAQVSMTPPYNITLNGAVSGASSVELNTSSNSEFLQKINGAFLMKINLPQGEYSFSLAGLKGSLRNLQSCRASVNTQPIGLVSFDDEAGSNVIVSDGERSNAQLSAYPLGNGPKVETPEPEPVKVAAAPVIAEPPIVVPPAMRDSNEPFEANEKAAMEQAEALGDENYSITRIHTPNAVIQPDAEQLSIEPVAQPQQVQPKAQPVKAFAVETVEDLSKPPAFDVNSVPIPAEAESYDAPVQRLASINDKQAEIYWDGKNIEGDIKPVMSQTYEQAERTPVVVPRIDTSDNPRRIDITNQEVARATRQVSNQELENELKNSQMASIAAPEVQQENIMPDQGELAPPMQAEAPYEDHMQVVTTEAIQSDIAAPAPQPVPAKSRWSAMAGENLKEVVANWSIQENVELVWDANDQFKVLNSLATSESYEQAIAGLLNQYNLQQYNSRPVGQLYIDPNTGEKMLIVQTN